MHSLRFVYDLEEEEMTLTPERLDEIEKIHQSHDWLPSSFKHLADGESKELIRLARLGLWAEEKAIPCLSYLRSGWHKPHSNPDCPCKRIAYDLLQPIENPDGIMVKSKRERDGF